MSWKVLVLAHLLIKILVRSEMCKYLTHDVCIHTIGGDGQSNPATPSGDSGVTVLQVILPQVQYAYS